MAISVARSIGGPRNLRRIIADSYLRLSLCSMVRIIRKLPTAAYVGCNRRKGEGGRGEGATHQNEREGGREEEGEKKRLHDGHDV